MGATGAYAASGEELQFILNTFSFLIWGALVMWMCAGFTMLEAGTVAHQERLDDLPQEHRALCDCRDHLLLGRLQPHVRRCTGRLDRHSQGFYTGPSGDELKLLSGQAAAVTEVTKAGHATMSNWFFQMVFVATTASIVSGTLAERVNLWAFFAFTAVLTIIIYPIVGAWTWGEGWLHAMGFKDFAGSTIVHSTGGWAALAGALVVGARYGKFRSDGSVKPTPPSNVPTVTLGRLHFVAWMVRLQRRLAARAVGRNRCSRHEQCAW